MIRSPVFYLHLLHLTIYSHFACVSSCAFGVRYMYDIVTTTMNRSIGWWNKQGILSIVSYQPCFIQLTGVLNLTDGGIPYKNRSTECRVQMSLTLYGKLNVPELGKMYLGLLKSECIGWKEISSYFRKIWIWKRRPSLPKQWQSET